jgi:hypothetical protein
MLANLARKRQACTCWWLALAILLAGPGWSADRVRSPDGRQAAVRSTTTRLTLVQGVRRVELGAIWGSDGPWWTPDSRYVVWLFKPGPKVNAAAYDTQRDQQARLTDADSSFLPPDTVAVSFTPKDALFYLYYPDEARTVRVALPLQ